MTWDRTAGEYRDREWLARQMATKSAGAIAREVGRDIHVVLYWARKFGLPVRPRGAMR